MADEKFTWEGFKKGRRQKLRPPARTPRLGSDSLRDFLAKPPKLPKLER